MLNQGPQKNQLQLVLEHFILHTIFPHIKLATSSKFKTKISILSRIWIIKSLKIAIKWPELASLLNQGFKLQCVTAHSTSSHQIDYV